MTTENDRKDSARRVKTQKSATQEIHTVQDAAGADMDETNGKPKRQRRQPTGVPLDHILTRSLVIKGLGISEKTFTRWKLSGLPIYENLGTAEAIVLPDELRAFIKSRPELVPSYHAERRERIAKRKKKE